MSLILEDSQVLLQCVLSDPIRILGWEHYVVSPQGWFWCPQNSRRTGWGFVEEPKRHLPGGHRKWKAREGITVGASSFRKLCSVHTRELTCLKASISPSESSQVPFARFPSNHLPLMIACSPFSVTPPHPHYPTTLPPAAATTTSHTKIHLRTEHRTAESWWRGVVVFSQLCFANLLWDFVSFCRKWNQGPWPFPIFQRKKRCFLKVKKETLCKDLGHTPGARLNAVSGIISNPTL